MTGQFGELRRLLPAIFALGVSTATFTATAAPVRAQSAAYYTAVLATPVSAPRTLIEGGVLWHCAGGQCLAPKDTSRPAVVCARLARKVGEVTRFATPAGDLAAEDLTRCNAH